VRDLQRKLVKLDRDWIYSGYFESKCLCVQYGNLDSTLPIFLRTLCLLIPFLDLPIKFFLLPSPSHMILSKHPLPVPFPTLFLLVLVSNLFVHYSKYNRDPTRDHTLAIMHVGSVIANHLSVPKASHMYNTPHAQDFFSRKVER
jgi:hypothetical protein